MILPGAIIFINNDLTDSIKDCLNKQLFITSEFDGYTYDEIINNNPDYPNRVKNSNQRIMVIRSFTEKDNRETADVVVFVTHGIASIERNKFGPPGKTYRVAELTWGKLCIFDPSVNFTKCC